jgi:acyl carrier protein
VKPSDKRLVAYLLLETGSKPSQVELRSLAAEHLPPFMLPSAFVLLDVWPLTPNGKLDRRALPMPDLTQTSRHYVEPRTPLEKEIAAIWQEVLGTERIGVEDSFVELGGHSLLATQVVSKVLVEFGVELSVSHLLSASTVAQFAKEIEQAQSRSSSSIQEFVTDAILPQDEPDLPDLSDLSDEEVELLLNGMLALEE